MPRWEYRCEDAFTALKQETVSRLGEEGWEMCAIRDRFSGGSDVWFKRPIPGPLLKLRPAPYDPETDE